MCRGPQAPPRAPPRVLACRSPALGSAAIGSGISSESSGSDCANVVNTDAQFEAIV